MPTDMRRSPPSPAADVRHPLRGHARIVSTCALVLLAVAVLVAIGGRSGIADASCSGVYSETVAPARGGQLPPLAVGDSTLILSLPTLRREGISANARGCRQYAEGIALLRTLRQKGKLPRVVIVALGANGPVTEGDVTMALSVIGATRDLVMVTHLEPGGIAAPDTALIRREPRTTPRTDRRARLGRLQPGPPRVVPARWAPPDIPRRRGLRAVPRPSHAADRGASQARVRILGLPRAVTGTPGTRFDR